MQNSNSNNKNLRKNYIYTGRKRRNTSKIECCTYTITIHIEKYIVRLYRCFWFCLFFYSRNIERWQWLVVVDRAFIKTDSFLLVSITCLIFRFICDRRTWWLQGACRSKSQGKRKRYQVQIYKTLSFNKSTALAADIDSVTGQIFLLDENFLRFFFKAAIAVRPTRRPPNTIQIVIEIYRVENKKYREKREREREIWVDTFISYLTTTIHGQLYS